MFQINDPLKSFWAITHLTCGARFEITGQKIVDAKNPIRCANCGIELPHTEILKKGVEEFDSALRDIELATKTLKEPYKKVFLINPPIKIIEEEETT